MIDTWMQHALHNINILEQFLILMIPTLCLNI
jgi:hypothetical protein